MMPKKYPLVQKKAVRLEFSRAVEEYNAELKEKKPMEEAYTQQGRAHSRRLHLDWAARPALTGRAAHAVESKAVVRLEVAVSPRLCLGCAAVGANLFEHALTM
jgi:hypothetical protein